MDTVGAGSDGVRDLVDVLRAEARSRLLDLLDEVSGRKVLVLDSTIVGPLDMIVHPSDLKDHGVEQWFKLSEEPVTTDSVQMLFLVRCTRVELVDWIAAQIHADEAAGKDRMYVVIFLPRKTDQCLERLGQGNVRANVRIVEYGLHFFPFDHDILSMEMPGVFRDYHVHGDASGLFYAAKALMYLQQQFGVIPLVHSIGMGGKCVVDVILRLRKEATSAHKEPQSAARVLSQPGVPPVMPHSKASQQDNASMAPRISEVIMIDRRVDVFSVLCSQFTYQALIDSVFGIQNNSVDVGNVEWSERKIGLSPEDPFFQEVRDLHIDKLGPLLAQRAGEIQKTYNEKDSVTQDSKAMAQYIKKFMSARSTHELLQTHINLAHHLKGVIQDEAYQTQLKLEDDITDRAAPSALEAIEDMIDQQKPFHEVLRLLCLFSLVNNGIRPKQLDVLKRSLVQAYGFEHTLTLLNLERVGLLRYQAGKSVWAPIKKQFNLFVEDATEKDISFAYSGYAPLSVRLVQMTSQAKGWRSSPDALNLLFGPAQELQQPLDGVEPCSNAVVLVCFLGGVTYGEIAALRRLGEMQGQRFLVVTTEFINTRTLFDSLKCEEIFRQVPVGSRRGQEPQRKGFGFWPGGR